MSDNNNVKEFLEAMKKDWRTRYAYVTSKKFEAMNIKDNPKVRSKIISVAHYDPCHIVRSEAVKTCNVLKILYKGEKIKLRKMRSLNNTIIAEKIKIQDIILNVSLRAGIPIFPRKSFIAAIDKECEAFYDQFKADYPKVYDLLDGHFAVADIYQNRKKKNKVQEAINSNDKNRMNKYIYGIYQYIPKEKLLDFCKKHNVELSA